MDEAAKIAFCKKMGIPYSGSAPTEAPQRPKVVCKRETCNNELVFGLFNDAKHRGYCSPICYRYRNKIKRTYEVSGLD